MATASYVFVTGAISLAEVVKCLETEDSRAEDCVGIEDDSLKAVWTVLYMEKRERAVHVRTFQKKQIFLFLRSEATVHTALCSCRYG